MFEFLTKFARSATPMRVEPTIGALAEGDTAPSSDRIAMADIFGAGPTFAGAHVTPRTAMTVSAFYACVQLIAGAIAQLTIPVYERVGDTSVAVDHDYWWLLNEQACPQWTASAFWEYVIATILLRGDSVCYIMRNRAGVATGFIPWPRSQVIIESQPSADPRVARRNRYYFQSDDGRFGADQDDVLHFPGFGFDGVTSMTAIQHGARQGLGIAIKADEFAGKFYSQGGQPQFAIQASGAMSPEQQDSFRDAWVRKYSGNGPNGIPLMLTEGLDIKELTMSAVDAQLLESRQFQVIDIARTLGVPPVMIGETSKTSSFGSGVEQMAIWFRQHTLGPHLQRCTDEMNRKLFRTTRFYVAFDTDALTAGDSKSQAEYFAKALGGPGTQGYMAVNEVRRKKGLPPLEGHDDVIRAGAAATPTDDKPAEPAANQESDDEDA